MANLPVPATESAVSDEFAELVGAQIARGRMPMDIARRMYPHDRKARLRTYMRIRRLALRDQRVSDRVLDDARLAQMAGLVPAALALNRRAAMGRPDAVKLLFEASGFHNPRVKHDHSGSIEIKLTMPRPERQVVDIPDADVVD